MLPLAAVTRTVTVLAPVRRPVAPRTSTRATLSAATAATVTELVPKSTVVEPPSTMVRPFTLKMASEVLLLSGVT